MPKTVYVLGAGFSKPAGFPLQGDLYSRLLERMYEPVLTYDLGLVQYFEPVRRFLERSGFVDRATGAPLSTLSLEDLFTLLDCVIDSRGGFCGYSWTALIGIRDNLIRSILGILHACSRDAQQTSGRFLRFAASLIKSRVDSRAADRPNDPFSIVSLNWDSLVEDSFYAVLADIGAIQNGRADADVDYCVYTTPLDGSPHTPSTKQKAAGILNLKLLKLHGSTTWLRCPNSNLVYTGLGLNKPAFEIYVNPQKSPFVEKYADGRDSAALPDLEPYIITPTFTKVFDLPHIQSTWHNAFVELREASDVVFIGYSLPEADYHFRALLRRAIRSTALVRVVLHPDDKPPEGERPKKSAYPADRYHQVFGRAQLPPANFDYDGVEGFIDRLAPEADAENVLHSLRTFFASLQPPEISLPAASAAVGASTVSANGSPDSAPG